MLGTKQRDTITGYTGVVTGLVTYLTGCKQALLVPPIDEKGALQKGEWFDEPRLERVDGSLISFDNSKAPGADIPPPRAY